MHNQKSLREDIDEYLEFGRPMGWNCKPASRSTMDKNARTSKELDDTVYAMRKRGYSHEKIRKELRVSTKRITRVIRERLT